MSNELDLMPPLDDDSGDLNSLLEQRAPRPRSRLTTVLAGTLVLLAGVLVGVLIGRGSGSPTAAPTMPFGPGAATQPAQPSAPDGDGSAPNPGAAGFAGRGTSGTVLENADGTLIIDTADGQATVTTSDATEVTKSEQVEVSSLTVGETVTIIGVEGEDGAIDAQRIIVGEAGFGPGGGFRP